MNGDDIQKSAFGRMAQGIDRAGAAMQQRRRYLDRAKQIYGTLDGVAFNDRSRSRLHTLRIIRHG